MSAFSGGGVFVFSGNRHPVKALANPAGPPWYISPEKFSLSTQKILHKITIHFCQPKNSHTISPLIFCQPLRFNKAHRPPLSFCQPISCYTIPAVITVTITWYEYTLVGRFTCRSRHRRGVLTFASHGDAMLTKGAFSSLHSLKETFSSLRSPKGEFLWFYGSKVSQHAG